MVEECFDTLCWVEGRRYTLSNNRSGVACCRIERIVRQRKVEHAQDAVLPGTGLAALPQLSLEEIDAPAA